MTDTYHAIEGTAVCARRRNAGLASTLKPEEQAELAKIEAEWEKFNKRPEPAFGAALPAVLRRPQRFQNYDPWPQVPFAEDDEQRSMTMLAAVLYGACWLLAIVALVVANWRS